MRHFHATIHASPTRLETLGERNIAGCSVAVLTVSPDVQTLSLPATFEEAHLALDQLPRLFIESDGSFVWVGDPSSTTAWQLDGQLCDGRDGLSHVELKGNCPREQFDQLLAIFHRDQTYPDPAALVFHLVKEGVWIDQHEFLRWAF